jgi:hypothetical protein
MLLLYNDKSKLKYGLHGRIEDALGNCGFKVNMATANKATTDGYVYPLEKQKQRTQRLEVMKRVIIYLRRPHGWTLKLHKQ